MAPQPAHGWLEALSLPVVSEHRARRCLPRKGFFEHRKEAKLIEGLGEGQACPNAPYLRRSKLAIQVSVAHGRAERSFIVDKKETSTL